MDHDDQRALSERDVVDLHAVAVGVGVSHPFVEWLGGSDRGRQDQQQEQGAEALSWACHGRSIAWKCFDLVLFRGPDVRNKIPLEMMVDWIEIFDCVRVVETDPVSLIGPAGVPGDGWVLGGSEMDELAEFHWIT